MKRRKGAKESIVNQITSLRGVTVEDDRRTKRGYGYLVEKPSKETRALISETRAIFKGDKLKDKLEKMDYNSLDSKDLLLYLKECVHSVGYKFPLVEGSKEHNIMKTLVQKYGSCTVFSIINFLYNSEQPFINKKVISLQYITSNISWLQAYGDYFLKGLDWKELMQMYKLVPVNNKESRQKENTTRESKFNNKFCSEVGVW